MVFQRPVLPRRTALANALYPLTRAGLPMAARLARARGAAPVADCRRGPAGQGAIAAYRIEGESLFFPNAPQPEPTS